MTPQNTFYILDAYSLIYQVFHAIPDMTGPAGQPTNAVFGVFRDLLTLLRVKKPGYLVAAFDGPGPVFRSDLFADYKAQRKPMPDDLIAQINVIKRVYEGFHVPILELSGYEADDVIATLARAGEKRGLDVRIATADKDARQLLSDRVRIVNFRKNFEELGVPELERDWGIKPSQVVDLLALTGDSVDNVPGVPGIGLKTASKLLQDFGDLDSLLAHPEKVAGAKKQEALRDHADSARRARELIVLHDQLPLKIDWDELRVTQADIRKLHELCRECGFHRFVQELGPDPGEAEVPWAMDYEIVDSVPKLEALVAELQGKTRLSIDTETTSIDPLEADLVGISVCWDQARAAYIAIRGPQGASLTPEATALESLRPLLADPNVEKIGQNLKYDLLVLARSGTRIAGPITDTMVLSYLLESGERNHSLDELSRRFLKHEMIPIDRLIGKGKTQKRMDEVEVKKVAEYAAEDADAAWRLSAILAPKAAEEGLWELYANLERPLISVLAEMERVGIAVDVFRLKRLGDEFAQRLAGLEKDIYSAAGKTFNIGSGPQLRKVLFEELKLPVISKTPGGEPSTAQEDLEELAGAHPLPRILIEHRRLAKLKSTYLDALPNLVKQDGRVHASFNQVVAATGRLSSSDPNLQNIPVRTEDGKQIRQAFIPGEPGWSLLTADYSQIELRVLAHFSGDRALRAAFEADQDIHSVVAGRIFGVDPAAVNSEQRRVAKTVNFGVIYGLSAYGLSNRLGIPKIEAEEFIESYFKQYAGVDAFMTKTLEFALEKGWVGTILGRKRAINGIKATTGRVRNSAERTAINTVIQGSAADLIKRAMIDVHERIEREGLRARMLLQIHDELVFEAPEEELDRLAKAVEECMTRAIAFDVPIKVDMGKGPNWLDQDSI